MQALFRARAIHRAHLSRRLLEGAAPDDEALGRWIDALVLDGLWLTKFPRVFSPTYGVEALDGLHKAWATGRAGAEAFATVATLRPRIDADVLRFVLAQPDEAWSERVELFYRGRALNKPLWQLVEVWFDEATRLQARLGTGPSLLETVFS